MKKGYICPSVCIIKIQGGDLLEGLKASGQKVIIPTNGNINKGNATSAASKYNYSLWDYDDEDIEDFEDKEDDKRRK
ncbi:MAG TPA: hypothetical protein DEQ27_02360 [Prevotella sp.]|nr:hypothetical protein [Prevotella sp.]